MVLKPAYPVEQLFELCNSLDQQGTDCQGLILVQQKLHAHSQMHQSVSLTLKLPPQGKLDSEKGDTRTRTSCGK